MFRVIYVAKFADAIYVLHAFQKKTQKTSRTDIDLATKRYGKLIGRLTMSENDITITESRGNVFIDLGFDPAEAEVMKLRAEIMILVGQRLKAEGWSQAEAARRLGVTQPRICRLIKGKVEDFSLDMLLTLAARAGFRPELRLT